MAWIKISELKLMRKSGYLKSYNEFEYLGRGFIGDSAVIYYKFKY